MKTVAVSTYKGGVGKTTTARDLSAALARAGARVLAVDLDRTQRHLMGFADGIPCVDFKATTSGRVKGVVFRAARDGYDYVIIDCPPSLGKESAAAIKSADIVIAPVVPEYLAVDGLQRVRRAIELVQRVRPLRACVLITMFNQKDVTHVFMKKTLEKELGTLVFSQPVPHRAAFNAAALAGVSIFDESPRSGGARAYKALAAEVSDHA